MKAGFCQYRIYSLARKNTLFFNNIYLIWFQVYNIQINW